MVQRPTADSSWSSPKLRGPPRTPEDLRGPRRTSEYPRGPEVPSISEDLRVSPKSRGSRRTSEYPRGPLFQHCYPPLVLYKTISIKRPTAGSGEASVVFFILNLIERNETQTQAGPSTKDHRHVLSEKKGGGNSIFPGTDRCARGVT